MDKINTGIIDEISREMISRYSRRYRELGHSVKTLGWGSEEQQVYRFQLAAEGMGDLSNKTLLDIGCGFGDLFKYLVSINNRPLFYTGWDINPDLVEESKKTWLKEKEKTNFEVHNLASPDKHFQSDIVLMLGLLNLNFHNIPDNYTYSRQLISNAFNSSKELLIVDFISNRRVDTYPEEDFIFYHDPVKMLEFALTLSPKIEIRHHYLPIPQREFMLYIYK